MEGEVRYSVDMADLAKLDLSEHGAWSYSNKPLPFSQNLSNYLKNLAAKLSYHKGPSFGPSHQNHSMKISSHSVITRDG